jgi:predicted small secreted protein
MGACTAHVERGEARSSSGNGKDAYDVFSGNNGVGQMKKVTTCAILASLLLGLAACNTVKGMGRDIQSVGDAGDKAM